MLGDEREGPSSPRDHLGRPRCVVTGVGAITADGIGCEPVWSSWVRDVDTPVVGAIEGLDPRRWLDRRSAARSAPFVHYAVVAADEAMAAADLPDLDPRRVGVVTSTIYGSLTIVEDQRGRFDREGALGVDAHYGPMVSESAAAAALSQRYGARGPSKAVLGACAGGGYAIADAVELIRSGRCDVVVAGASQEAVTPTMLASYRKLRVLAEDGWCRPFDRRRSGFAFGTGAGFFVLERLDHALDRGATPRAEVLGWANTNDADDPVRPSGDGAVECMLDALHDAGVPPDTVVAVNAHGTGTQLNDLVEASAILEVFGRPGPPVTSIKGVSGHLAGAAGAIEAVSVVLSMEHAAIPSVAVAHTPDPEIDLDLVVGAPRPWVPGPTVSNSFGLGGHNCSLVLAPYDSSAAPSGR